MGPASGPPERLSDWPVGMPTSPASPLDWADETLLADREAGLLRRLRRREGFAGAEGYTEQRNGLRRFDSKDDQRQLRGCLN